MRTVSKLEVVTSLIGSPIGEEVALINYLLNLPAVDILESTHLLEYELLNSKYYKTRTIGDSDDNFVFIYHEGILRGVIISLLRHPKYLVLDREVIIPETISKKYPEQFRDDYSVEVNRELAYQNIGEWRNLDLVLDGYAIGMLSNDYLVPLLGVFIDQVRVMKCITVNREMMLLIKDSAPELDKIAGVSAIRAEHNPRSISYLLGFDYDAKLQFVVVPSAYNEYLVVACDDVIESFNKLFKK